MKRIVLISCVSRKIKHRAKAKDLYQGPLFTNSLAYAQKLKPDKIYILSALHHLLNLEQVIEPYDVTLSQVSKTVRTKKPNLKVLSKEEASDWGQTVLRQLEEIADLKNDEFIILAGQSYISPIKKGINHIKEPLKGFSQGIRVQFLKKELS
jgi:hypothetical protein